MELHKVGCVVAGLSAFVDRVYPATVLAAKQDHTGNWRTTSTLYRERFRFAVAVNDDGAIVAAWSPVGYAFGTRFDSMDAAYDAVVPRIDTSCSSCGDHGTADELLARGCKPVDLPAGW